MKRSAKSLGILGTCLLILFPQLGRAQNTRAQQRAMDTVISVDFKECDRPKVQTPGAFNVNPANVTKLLNGVWVGTRTLRNGTAPMANYVMVIDMEAKESLIFEERGRSIKQNVFAQEYSGMSNASAPKITYFYCGSPNLGPFRDEFVKVSDVPRLKAMGGMLGTALPDAPLSKVWEALKDTKFAMESNETVNSAFYTVLLTPNKTGRFRDLRVDFVGQLRGSPNKSPAYANGQPLAGIESGVFRSVASTGGNYLISQDFAVPCSCNQEVKVEPDAPPLTNFRYTKVVIGPLGK